MTLLDVTQIDKLRGGKRSQAILDHLRDMRIADGLFSNRSVTITDLAWQRSQGFTICRDDPGQVWHAGHVNAILSTDEIAIVGTQTGGVYLINPAYGAIPVDQSHPATWLSREQTIHDRMAGTYLVRG